MDTSSPGQTDAPGLSRADAKVRSSGTSVPIRSSGLVAHRTTHATNGSVHARSCGTAVRVTMDGATRDGDSDDGQKAEKSGFHDLASHEVQNPAVSRKPSAHPNGEVRPIVPTWLFCSATTAQPWGRGG